MIKKIIKGLLSFAERIVSEYNNHESRHTEKKVKGNRPFGQKNDFPGEDSRQESLKSSQGVSDFTGSGYNGPGNVDREKRNSNMSQRNY